MALTGVSAVPAEPRAERGRSPGYRVGQLIALALPPSLYVLFVEHYGVNVLVHDDWAVEVPTIYFGLHGGRPFFWLLWLQYNEHRMVFPKLLYIGLGGLTSVNTKTFMLFSAGIFIATYLILLTLFRAYCGRWPGIFALLLLGSVWFSLSDYESALLSTQLAWYLALFFLMACLVALSRPRLNWWRFGGAVLIAIALSYSSMQGLLVWPVGLLCLWYRRRALEQWRRKLYLWVSFACVTTAIYFWDYNFSEAKGSSSFSTVSSHPIDSVRFFLIEVGNVVPSITGEYRLHMLVGLGVTLSAVAVVVHSSRETGRGALGTVLPLPAALIIFGMLFDFLAAFGRVGMGEQAALQPRYTMPTLIVLIGLIIYFEARRPKFQWARSRFGVVPGLSVAFCALLLVQVVVSTRVGLQGGENVYRSREVAVMTLRDLSSLPKAKAEVLVEQNIYPSLSALHNLVALAKEGHMSLFAR